MRSRSSRPAFYLKTSDMEMLGWLARFLYLQPRHFQALGGRHIVSIRRRLRQLLERGLVERLTLPFSRSKPVAAPPDEYVYRLGRRGVDLVRDRLDLDARYTAQKQAAFLEHDLTISTFHVTLTLAVTDCAPYELTWRQSDLLDWTQGSKPVPVNPDALFALTATDLPPGADTNCYFLEVERVRQHTYQDGESAIIRKARAFEAYALAGCRQTWDIDDFRVLLILPTAERVVGLRRKLVERGLASDRFWLTDVSRYSLSRPASVLEPIWTSPANDRLRALMSSAESPEQRSPVFITSGARRSDGTGWGG